MELELPTKLNSTSPVKIDSKSIVVIGANGAGKTRFGSEIETKYNEQTHRISAQKSLTMPEQVHTTSKESAEKDFLYGTPGGNSRHKIGSRWGNKPNTFLLDDYQKLMVLLHTEEYEISVKFKDSYNPGQNDGRPVTKLDRIQSIWEDLLPHRKLIKKPGLIETHPTGSPDKNYNALEMSDGERIIFYFIGEVVSAPNNSILIIDEPDMHLHKSISKKVWDKIEQERTDCTFIYLTHDIDFAFSRQNSIKIWAKSYDGSSWDYEVLEDNSDLPEQLYLEILGSRKPVLFIEGDNSSIDYKLFQLVFSEHTIKPLGGCNKVLETTKAFNEQHAFHHIESFGLIDRDRRTDEEINHFYNPNIWITKVAEVENFLLLEEIVGIVASAMHKNPNEVFEKAKNNIIEFFKTQIEFQAVQHTISRIERIFKNATNPNKVKEFKELEESMAKFWESQDFKKIYNDIKLVFDNLINSNDYNEILKVFNDKGILSKSRIVELCDLSTKNNAYLNFILSMLKQKSDNSKIIKNAIREKIDNCTT